MPAATFDELVQTKRELESLLEHPGYRRLIALVQEQARLRRLQTFNAPLGSLDDAFVLATARGEIAGLQFFQAAIEMVMADLRADIEAALAADRERQQETENDSG